MLNETIWIWIWIWIAKPSIQVVSELLGLMVAYNEGVGLGPLHYRDLERDEIRGLKLSRGNCNAHMQISSGGVLDIEWWLNNVDTATKAVWRDVPSIVVTTDASKWWVGRQQANGPLMSRNNNT